MTGYLLDTCVLSETRKLRPNAGVIRFLEGVDGTKLYLSVLTIGEMKKGVEKKRLTDAVAADQIGRWADRIETDFSDRILDVTAEVARLWGALSKEGRAPVVDTLIAATGLVHGLIVVTRNVKDFVATEVPLLNPWD
ncbi:type II toxin-antitoxin system VapC family toxin [Rhodomicrobium sp. Az07]|uniref:type II toxin-antitoxin system VapC family toxin n=1 Tax=Rhodomicrobium sp. Az07 TaxID=2839034 RepID=UPI001BEB88E1|nr:type II toxin-antitoxin system VapC family toxin [Rhodomicrobium sp. Az07]MBT3070850.1 type II toxin-antitoxin system VapC family toxin [Rhodomicrobium sp. Az07]